MNDETPLLRSVDWKSVLPFTQIFRAFRIAIHPSKLLLMLVGIISIYAGGRLLDTFYWTDRPVSGEIGQVHEQVLFDRGQTDFGEVRRAVLDRSRQQLEQLRADLMERERADGTTVDPQKFDRKSMIAVIERTRDRRAQAAREAYEALKEPSRTDRESRDAAIRTVYREAAVEAGLASQSASRGPFMTFLDYTTSQVDEIALGVIRFDWLPGENREPGRSGVFLGLYRLLFVAPSWAITHYPVATLILGAWSLLVWAVVGGAVARIAAVHVARDETISIRQALRFSLAKLLSFVSAPLLPLALIGVCALIFSLAGWLSELRYLGPTWSIIVGGLFVVVIGIGLFMACTMLGTFGGFGLMYPTIAVEGSDSFDAISRSFSYVFARPWKMAFYNLVAIVHASLTYLFLRFMVFLTLALVHYFLTVWTNDRGPDGTSSFANVLVSPDGFWHLGAAPTYASLTTAESIAWIGTSFWLYLFLGLLGAFVLSVYLSTNTIIYYLLRQDVDATELDDVYLEPDAEDFDDGPEPEPEAPSDSKPQPKPEAQADPKPGTASDVSSSPDTSPDSSTTASTTASTHESPAESSASPQPAQDPAPNADESKPT